MTAHEIKTFLGAALVAFGLTSTAALAAGEEVELLDGNFQHQGPFGTFDKAAVQRGFQVFKTVCATCHSAKYLAFRDLEDLGYTEDQVKAIAAEYTVTDGPNDDGEMFERPAAPFDYFPHPFPNDNAARAANGGGLPPDLSLITKAREGGEDYTYSLLLGYEEAPADVEVGEGMSYNAYFPGHQIKMPQPLYGDDVTYQDNTSSDIHQEAHDVVSFLHWLAEPKMEERKRTGIKAMIFLVIFSGIFYAYKRRIWADLH
ncbi:MAG: cytochrome c1 [Geminicoccaceae bacterium]|nr:cytochrome c1 [Geminicoccaceae bacterium]MCB9945675.1 cytochrome c1 [Geminicoccaceae bacterium]